MPLLGAMGFGMGLSMMPLNTHVLNAAPRQWVNRVTPLTSALQQVVVSFAVAGMTGYMTSRINHHVGAAGKGGNPLEATVLGFDDVFCCRPGWPSQASRFASFCANRRK